MMSAFSFAPEDPQERFRVPAFFKHLNECRAYDRSCCMLGHIGYIFRTTYSRSRLLPWDGLLGRPIRACASRSA